MISYGIFQAEVSQATSHLIRVRTVWFQIYLNIIIEQIETTDTT